MAAKGLTQTSSLIQISAAVTESAANTFTVEQIDLQLNPLDREVFVVLAINLDCSTPELVPGITTQVRAGLTTTSQTAMPSLADANCLSRLSQVIRTTGGEAVSFVSGALETPPATLEYIGIIATNDFFVQVQSEGMVGLGSATGKLYGYRATANADIFAALVQSEVLSA